MIARPTRPRSPGRLSAAVACLAAFGGSGCSSPAAPPPPLVASISILYEGGGATLPTAPAVSLSADGRLTIQGPLARGLVANQFGAAAQMVGPEVALTMTIDTGGRYVFGDGPRIGYAATVTGVPSSARRVRLVQVVDGGAAADLYAGALPSR